MSKNCANHGEGTDYAIVMGAALALALIGTLVHGVPVPWVHDELSNLFAAETFARFRLANPSPPIPDAFFAPYILVEPTFASKYPPGQALALTPGTWIGLPIVGVWVTGGLAAVALLWCARGELVPEAARIPVVVFVAAMLYASPWVSTYWGGFLPFAGGALVLGFFLRLRSGFPSAWAFAVLGTGLGTLALTRPFEGLLLSAALALLFMPEALRCVRKISRDAGLRSFLAGSAPVSAALGFQALLNRAVTGSALRLPYSEFHEQYQSVPLFRWQDRIEPVKAAPQLAAVEEWFGVGASAPEHLAVTLRSAWGAAEATGGVLFPWLVIGSAGFLLRTHSRIIVLAIALPMAQSVATYVHLPHYFAAVAPVWFLVLGLGVERAARRAPWPVFKTRRLAFSVMLVSVLPYWVLGDSRGGVNLAQEMREGLNAHAPGIVFAGRSGVHVPHLDWAYNGPDLDNEILLVNDGGVVRNCEVWRHFPDRNGVIVRVHGARSWTAELIEFETYCAAELTLFDGAERRRPR
jgi:hypothetical protein